MSSYTFLPGAQVHLSLPVVPVYTVEWSHDSDSAEPLHRFLYQADLPHPHHLFRFPGVQAPVSELSVASYTLNISQLLQFPVGPENR